MKKLLLIALCFTLVGCQADQLENDKVVSVESDKAIMTDNYSSTDVDCFISPMSAWEDKKDLLSTLIIDNESVGNEFELDKYADVDYLKNLDNKIAVEFGNEYWTSFNTKFVCNLGDNVDLVYGELDHEPFIKSNVLNEIWKKQMFLVNGDKVIELAEDWDSKVEGIDAEYDDRLVVGPVNVGMRGGDQNFETCTLENVKDGTFDLRCFYSYDFKAPDRSDAVEIYKLYTISFEGELLNVDTIEEIR